MVVLWPAELFNYRRCEECDTRLAFGTRLNMAAPERPPHSATQLPFLRDAARHDDVMHAWGNWLARATTRKAWEQGLDPDEVHGLVGPMPVGWELDSELLHRKCVLDTGPLWPRRLDGYRSWYGMGGHDPEGDDLLRALIVDCSVHRQHGAPPTLHPLHKSETPDDAFVTLRSPAEIRKLLTWEGDEARGRRAASVFERLLSADDDLPAAIVKAYMRPQEHLLELRSCGDRGKGLFARVPIAKGTVLLPAYGGVVLPSLLTRREMQAMHIHVTKADRERVKRDAELFDLNFDEVMYTSMKKRAAAAAAAAAAARAEAARQGENDGEGSLAGDDGYGAGGSGEPAAKRPRLEARPGKADAGAASAAGTGSGKGNTAAKTRGRAAAASDDDNDDDEDDEDDDEDASRRSRSGSDDDSGGSSDDDTTSDTMLRASVLAMYDISLAFKTATRQHEMSYDLLAWRLHNIMGYINDYHGVTDALSGKAYTAPNVVWEDATLGGIFPLVLVRACRDIQAGQELVVDYGPNYVRYWEFRKDAASSSSCSSR